MSAFDHTELLSEPLKGQIRNRPDDPRLHYEAGDEHRRHGRPEAALVAFATAARLAPQVAVAHFQVGNASYALGRLDDAIAAYERSQQLDPQASTANNLGNTFAQRQRIVEAVRAFEEATKLDPEFLPAYVNLAQAHISRGDHQSALNALMPALSRNPRHAKGQALLAESLVGIGNLESAIGVYAQAVESSPDDVELRTAYGTTLTKLSRFMEAAEQYTLALARRPNEAVLYNNLGEVHRSCGKIAESRADFARAIELDPRQPEMHSNMLLTMQYDPSVSPQRLFDESRRWAERHTAGVARFPQPTRDRNPQRKLRVGFVSADLGRHPVGRFLEPVLRYRDPAQLETFCYSIGRVDDEQTHRLQASADHWQVVTSLPPDALAELVRGDEIDILIDLAGHTAENRLLTFAAKPAPVQAAWAGYSGTTGLAEIDYVIADRWVVPPEEERYFTERVIRLPGCYVTFTPPEPDVAVGPLPAARNGFVTFGCFNNLAKMTPEVVELWSEVLRAVPSSRLFLKTKALGDAGVREHVERLFAEHGIEAERLRLEAAAARARLLAAYNEVDIGLDPFPFNGGITTLESLWMGVPVVSLRGNRFVGHATEDFLRHTGLGDWTAASPAEYLALAQSQAGDLATVAKLRAGLRKVMQNSPLAAGEAFTREFCAALRTMWSTWCAEST